MKYLFLINVTETFTNSLLSDDVINDSGVCQNCFIKFNSYDEHILIAEQIQSDLVSLMENKFYSVEDDIETKIKTEEDDSQEANDEIEYEPFVTEELFVTEDGSELTQEGDQEIEAIEEEEYQYEIVVDDTKEEVNGKQVRVTVPRIKPKEEAHEFIVIELEDRSRVFQCDICLKTFKDKSKLRSHREIHTSERNVICPTCSKAFKTMNCLRNHKRMHLPERTYYKCDQCEKRYTQKVRSLKLE